MPTVTREAVVTPIENMRVANRIWVVSWNVALAAAFGGLGVFGLGLMAAAVWYPTGIFWGTIVFLMGLLGVLLAIGFAMTAGNRPRDRPT